MNNPAAANRVATTIATFKWVIIGLIGLVTLIGFAAGAAQGGSGLALAFVFLIGGALEALVLYVVWGWFEQTLRMLADIATNTAIAAGLMPRPGSHLPPTPPASPYDS
jgi:hypothetical protein